MPKLLVLETANNPGNALTVPLAGAPTGYRPWVTAMGSGVRDTYVMRDSTGLWEAGVGYATAGAPNSFTRETVLAGSNGAGNRVAFSGQVDVYSDFLPERTPQYDDAGGIGIRAVTAGSHAVSRDYALGIPADRLSCTYTDWSNSGFAIGTGNVNLIYFVVPAKTRRIVGSYWLDVANTDAPVVAIVTQAALINQSSGQDIAQRGGAISRSANGYGGGLGGGFNFTFDTPVGANVLLALRVRKGADTGSVYAYNGGLYAACTLEAGA